MEEKIKQLRVMMKNLGVRDETADIIIWRLNDEQLEELLDCLTYREENHLETDEQKVIKAYLILLGEIEVELEDEDEDEDE